MSDPKELILGKVWTCQKNQFWGKWGVITLCRSVRAGEELNKCEQFRIEGFSVWQPTPTGRNRGYFVRPNPAAEDLHPLSWMLLHESFEVLWRYFCGTLNVFWGKLSDPTQPQRIYIHCFCIQLLTYSGGTIELLWGYFWGTLDVFWGTLLFPNQLQRIYIRCFCIKLLLLLLDRAGFLQSKV